MKDIILLLVLLLFCSCSDAALIKESSPECPEVEKPVTVLFVPDKRGRLDVSEAEAAKILPGTIVYLRGSFRSVRIVGLKGSAATPIYITNYPGETLVVGDKDWSGGGYSNAIQLLQCQHIILGGDKDDTSAFRIEGSTDPKGQGSYIGISLQPFTDHIEVKNLSISNGGVGILSKTNPEKDDPSTWYPNTWLDGLSIHNIRISDVVGEAMYIGHSSIYWGWDENGKGYNAGAEPDNPAHTFVRPVMWRNVKVYNNVLKGMGWDGIQISSADQLEIYGNEVSDYGTLRIGSQCMGILVGGNSTNTYVHDNYVHDGYGDAFQFHGAGGDSSTHVVTNNLFTNTQGSGMGFYGLVNNATVDVYNNTVANSYSFAMVANGRGKLLTVRSRFNLFIACYLQSPGEMGKYIRTMNNAVVQQTDDKSFASPDTAGVDALNFYQPLAGSPVGKAGYRK